MFFTPPDLNSDAMRARHREKMLRNGVFVAVLAVCSMLFLMVMWPAEDLSEPLKLDSSPKLSAVGGTWRVKDLQWTQVGDQWRVQAFFVPYRGPMQRVTETELLKSMCGAVLTGLPGKPDSVTGRDAVYRLDLNAQTVGGDVDWAHAIFDSYAPVVVQDGACQLSETSNRDFYSPHYPGALEGWVVRKAYLKPQGEGSQLQLTFLFTGEGSPDQEGFPYFQACQLAMSDERIWEAIEKIGAQDDALAALPIVEVQVSAKKQKGSSIFSVAWGKSATFLFSNARCVAAAEEQTL